MRSCLSYGKLHCTWQWLKGATFNINLWRRNWRHHMPSSRPSSTPMTDTIEWCHDWPHRFASYAYVWLTGKPKAQREDWKRSKEPNFGRQELMLWLSFHLFTIIDFFFFCFFNKSTKEKILLSIFQVGNKNMSRYNVYRVFI